MENLLAKILEKKQFKFRYRGVLSDHEVSIHLPDLTGKEYNTWGDWGPMYQFKLNSDYPISIEINSQTGLSETLRVHLSILRIESPMSATEREEYPLFMTIPIEDRNSKIELYFNRYGELGDVRSRLDTKNFEPIRETL
ncbi:MAG: hypothetical protein EP326_15365 [Deltaproteobacteria bacterium]|nr:MAG: hypothetical protein EP326_15365 [Deltaproteobacteria bacterium]